MLNWEPKPRVARTVVGSRRHRSLVGRIRAISHPRLCPRPIARLNYIPLRPEVTVAVGASHERLLAHLDSDLNMGLSLRPGRCEYSSGEIEDR